MVKKRKEVENMKKLRKILALVLCFAVFQMSFVPSFANETMYGPSEVVDFDEEVTGQRGDEYVKIGASLRNARASKYLTISHYFQNGEVWSDDVMQTAGLTIGEAGCGVCSYAMILTHYGKTQNPRWANKTIGNAACPFAYEAAGNANSLTVYANKVPKDNNTAINYIIASIDDAKPVMVYMTKGNYTHFVAAYGYNGTTVSIKDSERSWNYSTLNTYINNGWTVKRLVSYKLKVK